MKTDYGFATSLSGEEALLDLLKNNKDNRMAFEYLMIRYMLYGRLDDFARKHGFLVTAGSDFHGENRIERKLGISASGMRIADAYARPFLNDF